MLTTTGLDGMNLRTLRCIILPYRLPLLRHLADTILMSHQHVTIRHQHGITNLAASLWIVILPRHLSVFDDIHATLLAFASIQEVIAAETSVNSPLRPHKGHALCNQEE